MNTFRMAALIMALTVSPASAQPKAGQVQPDRIDFGAAYVGSTVEASFMVFEPGKDTKVLFNVTAPEFIKVRRAGTHAQQFGAGNDFICGTVEFILDTANAGEFKGEIAVTVGRSTAKLPVSATIKPSTPGLIRVLVAETPFERYSTADGKTYHEWTRLVKDSSLDVSYLLPEQGKPVLRDLDLSRFDCVLVPAAALDFLTPGDAKRARDYAEKGGRVIVAANHFFGHSVQGANSILAGSGLEIIDKEASPNGQNDVTLRENDFDPRLVKFGVKSARFFRASPIRITDSEKPRVLAQAVGVGNPGDGFVAMTKVGKGEMLALGESLWCFWITKERAKGTDNAKLLLWLLMRSRE